MGYEAFCLKGLSKKENYVKPDIDVYIMVSNVYMLSGELATFDW